VEIAYSISEPWRGRGFATEAAVALRDFAGCQPEVRCVLAHTLPETGASCRVLTKAGFRWAGEHCDPEDGMVWRWEFPISQ
jgi:[ribosomal protein S5]-alanine N-acetyltransferase